MRSACCIPKATNTHSQYVILITFPLQQQLQERSSMLRYTYTACLVLVQFISAAVIPLASLITITGNENWECVKELRHETPDSAMADSTKRNTTVTAVPNNLKIQMAVRYNTEVKKVKLPLSTPWRRVQEVEVQLHPFITSALNGDDRFNSKKESR
jgi:hypothetical protein